MGKESRELRRRSFKLSFNQKKQFSYWIFLIPFLLGFLLIMFEIYFNSLKYSFHNVVLDGADGFHLEWLGLSNYRYALKKDPDFVVNIQSAILQMLTNIPLVVLYSLMIAVILNREMKGRTFFRAVFFIPVILATGFMTKADMNNMISDQMWNNMGTAAASAADSEMANGLFNGAEIQEFLLSLSFSTKVSDFILNAAQNIYNIVNISGVQMVIFLAGIQSISPAIYESASIDGATAWESFWLITFPMISPLVIVNVIYTVIDSFTSSDNIIMLQIEEQTFKSNGMGLASAMAWFYFLVVAICLVVITLIIRGYVYYQQRD
ncbi:MAG: sugar ABC transporter permease [Clostridia bacterium]|nr:sugar ABC transporter permease [Clostridia bacterium]